MHNHPPIKKPGVGGGFGATVVRGAVIYCSTLQSQRWGEVTKISRASNDVVRGYAIRLIKFKVKKFDTNFGTFHLTFSSKLPSNEFNF